MKSILSRIIIILGLFTGVSALTSCDVHQWPEPNNEPPLESEIPQQPQEPNVNVKLSLKYFTDFTYRYYNYDSKAGTLSESEDGDTYDNIYNLEVGVPMKVTVKVHQDNSNRTLVLSESFIKELDENFDTDVELELPSGDNYLITVWGHLLDQNGEALYDDSDFNSIGLIKEKYTGNTEMRDAFRGRMKLSVSSEGEYNGVIDMHRPMGKLEFITTGLQDFFNNEEKNQGTRAVSADDYTVKISYPAYYPTHYMAMEDRLEYASQGYSFTTPLTVGNGNETSLGFDNVMINDTEDAAVQAQIALIGKDGSQVASTGMITIPMQRDRHAVVKGNFLTVNGNGGVGLDPDFDGDFNVPIY